MRQEKLAINKEEKKKNKSLALKPEDSDSEGDMSLMVKKLQMIFEAWETRRRGKSK